MICFGTACEEQSHAHTPHQPRSARDALHRPRKQAPRDAHHPPRAPHAPLPLMPPPYHTHFLLQVVFKSVSLPPLLARYSSFYRHGSHGGGPGGADERHAAHGRTELHKRNNKGQCPPPSPPSFPLPEPFKVQQHTHHCLHCLYPSGEGREGGGEGVERG